MRATLHPEMPAKAVITLWLERIALLAICAAYLQGGLVKALHFPGAVAEMHHFGLQPAELLAVAIIILELGASAMILSGWFRWLGALLLAVFTLAATFVANRFWEISQPDSAMVMNAFFEHLGLCGALLLIVLNDISQRTAPNASSR